MLQATWPGVNGTTPSPSEIDGLTILGFCRYPCAVYLTVLFETQDAGRTDWPVPERFYPAEGSPLEPAEPFRF